MGRSGSSVAVPEVAVPEVAVSEVALSPHRPTAAPLPLPGIRRGRFRRCKIDGSLQALHDGADGPARELATSWWRPLR